MISAVDLLPTFCELAGAKLPEAYRPDGVSQVATLFGKNQPDEEQGVVLEDAIALAHPKVPALPLGFYAMVHQNWKLLTNRDATYAEFGRHHRRPV